MRTCPSFRSTSPHSRPTDESCRNCQSIPSDCCEQEETMTDQLTLPDAPEGPARPDPAPGSGNVALAAAGVAAVPALCLPQARPRPGLLDLRLRGVGRGDGVGGHPDRRRPGAALRRLDRRCRRRAAPGAARWRGRRPDPAEAHPAVRRHPRVRRHGPRGAALDLRPHPGLAPRRGVLRHRHGDGVLLPGLLGLAALARGRVRPDGGQRVRGDGPADPRSGDRPRRGGVVVGAVSSGAAVGVAAVLRAGRPGRAQLRPADAGPP